MSWTDEDVSAAAGSIEKSLQANNIRLTHHVIDSGDQAKEPLQSINEVLHRYSFGIVYTAISRV